jgi:hypothetical protein
MLAYWFTKKAEFERKIKMQDYKKIKCEAFTSGDSFGRCEQ